MCSKKGMSESRRVCVCIYLLILEDEEGYGQAREVGSSQVHCFYSKKNLKKKIRDFSLSLKKSKEQLTAYEMLKFHLFIYIVLYVLLVLLAE